ncbi:MAG: hypothetical protein J6Z04_08145 [Clostridia bacterium]|nr:hypothetical protein [Clostridia bacterium]
MKKLTVALALILCLVICAFAFASCGPKKPASTTAATTPATTDGNSGVCQHVWGEFEIDTPATCTTPGIKSKYCTICDMQDPDSITEIPMTEHVPAEEYTVDTKPTCSDLGYKSKHCTVCGNPVASTVESIDKDPDAHNVEQWNVIEQATLFADGSRTGICTYCEQPQNEEYSSIVEQKYTTESVEKRLFVEQNIYSELLNNGEKHFYPDESNGGLGLDLYVEYSFLWNNTFENLGNNSTSGGHAIIDTRLCTESGDKGKGNDLTWMSLKNNASGSDCTFAGGFEYGSLRTVEFGPAGMSTRTAGGVGTTYADFPNIGGDDQANPEWGWHRVGVKFHQEVSNEAALKADTTGDVEATYYFFVETYIDGVLVSRLSNASSPDFGASTAIKENLLFTAKADKVGGIEYEDGDEGCYVNGMRLPFFNTTTGTAYVVYADYFATAGTGFVQDVTRVDTPAANVYTTADNTELPGAIYYALN